MGWCFRCVSGVFSVSCCMVPGLISSVLDTWPPQCAVPTPEQGHPGGPGWGGALEGVWALSWTRACTTNAGSRPITRVRASSSGTKPALKAAAPADGQNPHQLQPSLRGAPGSTNRASRPRPLKTAPAQQTQRAETQESPRIRLQHSVPAWTLLPMRFAQHDGRLSIAWLHALSSSGAE